MTLVCRKHCSGHFERAEGESRNLHATVLLIQISPLRPEPEAVQGYGRSLDLARDRNDSRSFLHSIMKIGDLWNPLVEVGNLHYNDGVIRR